MLGHKLLGHTQIVRWNRRKLDLSSAFCYLPGYPRGEEHRQVTRGAHYLAQQGNTGPQEDGHGDRDENTDEKDSDEEEQDENEDE